MTIRTSSLARVIPLALLAASCAAETSAPIDEGAEPLANSQLAPAGAAAPLSAVPALTSQMSPNGFQPAMFHGMWGSDGPIQTADLNGDHKADFFMWRDATKRWSVNLSTGSEFSGQAWAGDWGSDGPNFVGDLNGDGKQDVFMWRASNNDWTVNISTGSGFVPAIWHGAWGSDGPIHVGDLNGDGRTDVFMWRDTDKVWTVNLSTGSGWNAQIWHGDWGSDGPIQVGDLNGDGKTDVFMWRAAGNDWTVNLSTGSGFAPAIWHGAWGSDGTIHTGDFNGDGKTDVAMFRASDATWSMNLSTGSGWSMQQWLGGCESDGPSVLGDFNGDHMTDVATWRDATKDYVVSLSRGNGFTLQRWTGDWGSDGAMHVADVNGDGTTDIVMSRDSDHVWTLNLGHAVPLGPARAYKSEVDAVEVTQATQDLDNTVPLFAGKRTLVRAYVDPGACTAGAPATASAIAMLYDASGRLVWSSNWQSKTVPRLIHRENTDDTINFDFTPSEGWDARQTYRLDVTSGAGMTRSTYLRFYASVPLHIRPFWNLGAGARVDTTDFANLLTRVEAMYPTAHIVQHDLGDAPARAGWADMLEWKIAATKLDQQQIALGQQPTHCSDCEFVGVGSGGGYGGIALLTPSPVAYDRRIVVSVGAAQSYTDINWGGHTVAQEVAHNIGGRFHAFSNAGEPFTDANFPYTLGHIADDGVYGLWNAVSHGRVHGAEAGVFPGENGAWKVVAPFNASNAPRFDFMTYQYTDDPLWVSDYTYRGLCGAMRMGYFDTEYAKIAQLPAGSLPDASVCPSTLGAYNPPAGRRVTLHLKSNPGCIPTNVTVTSSTGGMKCTIDGNTTDNYCTITTTDSAVTLYTNGPQNRFLGWEGDCAGNGTSCSLSLDTDKLVDASYCALVP